MTTTLDLETNISELLIHTHDFLHRELGENMDTQDPLLFSIVSGFLSILAIYDDYKRLPKPEQAPFIFQQEMPT